MANIIVVGYSSTMNTKDRALWSKLMREGLHDGEGESDANYPFPEMSRRFGKAWIIYLTASYGAKDGMDDESFSRVHGGVPLSFIRKNLAPPFQDA